LTVDDRLQSCASMILTNRVPMKQIQEWLGHSNFSTTANIYAHLDYASKISSAEAMMTGMHLDGLAQTALKSGKNGLGFETFSE